jgi:hypothetical protein
VLLGATRIQNVVVRWCLYSIPSSYPCLLFIALFVCNLIRRCFFNQLYQREEEVAVKQVTEKDDDARVGCAAHKLEIFSDLLY